MERDIIRDPHFFLNASIYESCDVREFLTCIKLKAVKTNLKRRRNELPFAKDLMFQSICLSSNLNDVFERTKPVKQDEAFLVHFSS